MIERLSRTKLLRFLDLRSRTAPCLDISLPLLMVAEPSKPMPFWWLSWGTTYSSLFLVPNGPDGPDGPETPDLSNSALSRAPLTVSSLTFWMVVLPILGSNPAWVVRKFCFFTNSFSCRLDWSISSSRLYKDVAAFYVVRLLTFVGRVLSQF